MKDRVLRDIGAKGHLGDWHSIDWKLVSQRVKNLRQRIYRATINHQWNLVRSLTKLMLRSFSNLLLSVRRATQLNRGKRTGGVDRRRALIRISVWLWFTKCWDIRYGRSNQPDESTSLRQMESSGLWESLLSLTASLRRSLRTRSSQTGRRDSKQTASGFVPAEAATTPSPNAISD